MPEDSSHCRFPNCKCEKHLALKFQDYCTYKSYGHDISINSDVVNYVDNSAFTTSRPFQESQCSFANTLSNSENTTQGPPIPNHDNFLPLIAGETSETTFYISTINDYLAYLSKEF